MSGYDGLIATISGERHDVAALVIRALLIPLALIHRAGLEIYLTPYRWGIRKRYRLNCPVICVGNLSSGGTGKTPFTIALGESLMKSGFSFAVLTRGYGGSLEKNNGVVSDGERIMLSAAESGDEAQEIAWSLKSAPVIVGKDRRQTGSVAVERFHSDLVILDDGMQFWQLHQDFRIVMLDPERPFENGWMLPAGLLREPPSHLKRADAIVIVQKGQSKSVHKETVEKMIDRVAKSVPLFYAHLEPQSLVTINPGQGHNIGDDRPIEWLKGKRVGAFCGIGRPRRFHRTLENLGAVVGNWVQFPDHYPYSEAEVQKIIQQAQSADVKAIITTMKDYARLQSLPLGDRDIPVMALRTRLVVEKMDELLAVLISSLKINQNIVASEDVGR